MDEGPKPDQTPDHVWRMRALLLAPLFTPLATDGGPPAQLKLESRVPAQSRTYDGLTVAIEEPAEQFILDRFPASGGHAPLWLVADIPASSEPESAIAAVGPKVELLLDLMSFDMGAPLQLGQVSLLDVTPPLEVGDTRRTVTFGEPPFGPNTRATDMQAIQGRLIGELPSCLPEVSDSRGNAALRWFNKALSTDLLHDQFIFLWIALEILCDESGVKVVEDYVGRCGHTISSCPECGERTTKLVRGATIRAYLETFEVTPEQSKKLWRMRQLMHGAFPFDSKKLTELAPLVQLLRAVVAEGMKERLGISPADPPIVSPAGLSIHPAMAVSGTTSIIESQCRPLAPPQGGQ